MLAISGFDDFRRKYEAVKGQSPIYVFILFDERPSHRVVENFVRESFAWLDRLAAAARVFGFAFVHWDHERDELANPSLEIAALFGIEPNQMPGVVLFSLFDDREDVNDGVFLPIKTEVLSSTIEQLEEYFADLFSLIQRAQHDMSPDRSVLDELRDDISRARRRERLRPLSRWSRDRVENLVNLPNKLLESVATAFGAEAARRMMGGG